MGAGAVIVGTGFAGVSAAFAMRAAGYYDSITIVGDEPHVPYERPPLSKAVLHADDKYPPELRPAADYEAAGITLVREVSAVGLDPLSHDVELSDGRSLLYDNLLLATGAEPRVLDVPGADNGPVHYLRTPSDAHALRQVLSPDRRIAIIGGGLIGLEVATAARHRGAQVTVIEAAPRVLGRGVPTALADALAAEHRGQGVDIRVAAGLAEIIWSGADAALVFSDGTAFRADVVVAAIGVMPRTTLADDAGLPTGNGIIADDCLRCGEAIFAAGDCVLFEHPLFGRRMRLESWDAAGDLGAIAGRNMAAPPAPVDFVPWMWSDQYDLGLYISGVPDAGVQTITRRAEDGTVLLFHLDDHGRLMGASGLGQGTSAARELKIARRLIGQHATPDPDYLADPRRTLKPLLVREPAPAT